MLQLLLRNGKYVNSNGVFEGDIAVEDGRIVQIGFNLNFPAQKTIDVNGRYVLPGIIDAHVHLPWPSSSFDSVDDYESGSIAAAHGGVTTIIEYVVPDMDGGLAPALEKQRLLAAEKSYVDFSFHAILRKVTDETLAEMAEVVEMGFPSFKIYTAYDGFRLGDDEILKALTYARDLGALTCFHAEDGLLVNYAIEQHAITGSTHVRYFPEGHPRLADVEGTHRVLAYARQLNARVHIVHVNTTEGAEMIRQARRDGLLATGETCPQYLLFTADVYKTGLPSATFFVLAPAIREETDRSALWEAIKSNDLQMIATDHCPYTSEQKTRNELDYRKIPGGAAGIETSLPLLFTNGVLTGRIPIERLVDLMSTNPAKIFNLYPQKGVIAVGSDADLVVLNLGTKSEIHASGLHSRIDSTIYEGQQIQVQVDTVISRGSVLVENCQLSALRPDGKVVRRLPYSV